MGYSRRSRPVPRRGGAARVRGLCRSALLLFARAVLTVGALALIAVAIVYLRLLQGPIALPGVARLLAQQMSEVSDQVRLDVEAVVLTLGEGAATSGLQFRDVEITSSDGERLFAAPRVGVRFHLSDLLQRRLEPVRIMLIEPHAQIIRTEDGRLRFGMGQGLGVPSANGAGGRDGFAAVSEVIDGLVGDRPPATGLSRLERIEIIDANLTFDDRRSGSRWNTRHANLRLWRYPGGARAVLDIERRSRGGAALSLAADRPAGAGRTDLRLQFSGIESTRLASQARELDWLGLIGGSVGGEVSATLKRNGMLSGLEGVIVAAGGVIRGLGDPVPFNSAELKFRVDPELDRLHIERARLIAPHFGATVSGYADLERGRDGGIEALAGQFDIGALRAELPREFAAPLEFDGGRVTARWSIPGQRFEVAGGRLARGDLAFTVDGEARGTRAGWITDIRAEAEGMTVDELVAFWPIARAGNARAWVDTHITEGRLDRVTAQMRLGGTEPQLALDFDYSGVRVDYVDGMSPVEEARGTGHVTFHDLYMALDSGRLAPGDGDPLELAGSRLAIRGFWDGVPPAEIALKATGPIGAALTVIDQPPLRLMSRLDRELDPIDGMASVEVDLTIPLIRKLRLVDIGVDARAALSEVSTTFAISPRQSVDVRADRLQLAADADGLRLSGPARIEGAEVSLDWRERFGAGRSGRTIDIEGVANGPLLAAVGADVLPVEGAPPFDLRLAQADGGPLDFTIDADLAPTAIEIAALDWAKLPGVPATLRAAGSQGQGVDFRSLTLDSPGLDLTGSLRLDAEGRLVSGALGEVRLIGLGSFAAAFREGPGGVLEIDLSGRQLDLSKRIGQSDGSGGGPGADGPGASSRVRLSLNFERLKLTERIALAPGRGTIEQHPSGAMEGRLEGSLGAAPVTIDFAVPASGPGELVMASPDAGAVLRATDLYADAEGGRLLLEARIGTDDAPGLSGLARIDDVRVRSQSTFRSMLRDGGMDSAGETVATSGIGFRKVVVPFTYRDGMLRLDDAVASSPAVALKVNGTVNERSNQVDLAGVLSPAYGLTGALNEVPLLGSILGGEGEGILAMTFRMRGPVEDPLFTVNPLSLLAPGFLRKIFTAPTGEVSDEFRENLGQGRR